MFKRPHLEKHAKDQSLEVRQYGKILPLDSVKPLAKPQKAKRQNISFDTYKKSVCQKPQDKKRPVLALHQKKAASKCNSRTSKELISDSKNTTVEKVTNDLEPLDTIGELIEKAKQELEEQNRTKAETSTFLDFYAGESIKSHFIRTNIGHRIHIFQCQEGPDGGHGDQSVLDDQK